MRPARLLRVEGLDEFRTDLRTAQADYPEAVRLAGYELAKSITTRAKLRAAARGGVARKAAVSSLRAYRTSRGGAVAAGGARAPFFWGAEFGAKQYRRFDSWRGNQWGGWSGGPGYFLNPTIREDARALLRGYIETLDERVHSQAFPD